MGRARKALTVAVIAVLALLAAGCAQETKNFAFQAREKIEPLVSPSKKPEAQAYIEGRGTPKPVTIVNEEGAATAVFDPAAAEDTDLVSLTMSYKIVVPEHTTSAYEKLLWGKNSKAVITSLIPKTVPNRQKVLSVQFSVKPSRIFDLGANRYAEFVIKNPKNDFTIEIQAKVRLLRYDLTTALDSQAPAIADSPTLAGYLKQEQYLEINDPTIKQLAGQLRGADEIETVSKAYTYVIRNMTYDKVAAGSEHTGAVGAARAAEVKKGVCVEYTDLLVALCRANGIPARCIGGITTERADATKGHAWAEVYLKKYGWVPFDPTWGQTKGATFYRLKPSYIYLTDVRNDEVINKSDIYGYRYTGMPVKIGYSASVDSGRAKYLSALLADINKDKAELAKIKNELDTAYVGVESMKAQLDEAKQTIDRLRGELDIRAGTDPAAYEAAASKYNSMVASYNEKIASYNKAVSAYKSIQDRHETMRQKENATIQKYNYLNYFETDHAQQ